jgi:hypothetical protein
VATRHDEIEQVLQQMGPLQFNPRLGQRLVLVDEGEPWDQPLAMVVEHGQGDVGVALITPAPTPSTAAPAASTCSPSAAPTATTARRCRPDRTTTPSRVENGLDPDDLLGRRFGHHLNFWSMSQRRLTQRVDLGDQHQMVFEVRPAQAEADHPGVRPEGLATSAPTIISSSAGRGSTARPR